MKKVYESARVASATERVQVFARVYRKSETDEFVARLYVDGKLYAPADAFESFNRYDKASVNDAFIAARSTAEDMVRRTQVAR